MKKILLFIALFLAANSYGKDYYVEDFGISGDNRTVNTRSIQTAVDFISENGGGRLIFTPGSYLTGTFFIKSDVTVHLEAGATIFGTANPFDYPTEEVTKWQSLIFSVGQKNVGITGEGRINGKGFELSSHSISMVYRGIIKDELLWDRVREPRRPENIYFRECENVTIKGITMQNSGNWNQIYDQCEHVLIEGIKVDNNYYWNNDGIDIVDSKHVIIRDCYIDAADDVFCLKSHDPTKLVEDVLIENCVGRSGANGLKFGTVSKGGFKNIRVKNLTIFDTYRSAITLQAVDGGYVEDVVIDGVRSINTGNPIFLRVGDRNLKEDYQMAPEKSYMKDVIIKNVYAEVPLEKADAGYNYEGPVEDLPRNVSPSGIVGLPGQNIQNVQLENIEIIYPGEADSVYAYRGLSPEELESIPEMPKAYPEFSQFKELPAWGFFIRHAENISFKNVTLKAKSSDYRPAVVVMEADDIKFSNVNVEEPEAGNKEQLFFYKTENTSVK